jgi:hypothetical protein
MPSASTSDDTTSLGYQQQPGSPFKTPGPPTSSHIKKHHKHPSKTSRFLKGEIKLFRGKQHNSRYNKSMESIPAQEYLDNSMVESSQDPDVVEYIGHRKSGSQNNIAVSSKTVMDRRLTDQFSSGGNWNHSRNLAGQNSFDSTKEDDIQVLNSNEPLMKYSRAFREPARAPRVSEDDVAIEDVEDESVHDNVEFHANSRHRPKANRR